MEILVAIPSSVLNTNIASLIAQRNLAGAQSKLALNVERLSSGLRINRASDDASGMAVATVINSQIRITSTAYRNANDAMSMMQTAEGALQEAGDMLLRMKELATQGSNDSMSREQYKFLVDEMKQLMEELGNTAMRVKFNGNYLMGTFAARDNGTVFGSVAGVSEDTVLSPANTDVDWTFMTGPGDEDKMKILQIPIFATASHGRAIFETNDTPLPIGELGALNELYTRIMRIAGAGASADENSTIASGFAPQQGQGYNAFGTVKLYVSAGVFYNEESNQADPSRLETFNELVDRALVQINEHRSYFGAFFGRLEHNVANLSALTENLSAALSRVQDTDYGAETSALTRVQILQQAATAMLAQANAMPNVVLGLLKSQ
jgi:flagellin